MTGGTSVSGEGNMSPIESNYVGMIEKLSSKNTTLKKWIKTLVGTTIVGTVVGLGIGYDWGNASERRDMNSDIIKHNTQIDNLRNNYEAQIAERDSTINILQPKAQAYDGLVQSQEAESTSLDSLVD